MVKVRISLWAASLIRVFSDLRSDFAIFGLPSGHDPYYFNQ